VLVRSLARVGDIAAFSARLPRAEPPSEQAALRALLRLSFEADYAKVVASPAGDLAIAFELPRAVATPTILEGARARLAEYATVGASGLADHAAGTGAGAPAWGCSRWRCR
jgi:hypothetical protein